MDRKEWAKNEIEMFKEKNKEGYEYTISCMEAAYKAFEVLCDQGHSGFSIGITKRILNDLIDGIPMIPINEYNISEWKMVNSYKNKTIYQNSRMTSLFKHVYHDGRVKYSDADRIIAFDIGDTIGYYSGFVSDIINKMHPIKFPYYGNEELKVYTESFLTDEKNGDYDTFGILYVDSKKYGREEINRYFTERNYKFVEITKEEYDILKSKKIK